MKIDGETLTQLLSSLDEYNPVVNQFVEKITKGLVPVAMIILSILLYLELADMNQRMRVEQGRISNEIFLSVAWKYLIGFFLILYSDEIFDSIVWFTNAIGNIISKITTNKSELKFVVPEVKGKVKTMQKMILEGMKALAYFTNWFAEMVTKVLVFLRAVELYIFKAAAPVLVAFYVSEEWRPITTRFIKLFAAIAIQGFLIIIILKIYPALIANDMFHIAANGSWQENLADMFTCLLRSFVFIFVLIGSQRKAKEWMGG